MTVSVHLDDTDYQFEIHSLMQSNAIALQWGKNFVDEVYNVLFLLTTHQKDVDSPIYSFGVVVLY